MVIRFGKHCGKSIEVLVLKEPDYVAWMLDQEGATGKLAYAQLEVSRFLKQFDQKPFLCRCGGTDCTKRATRCSLYHGSMTPRWWCDGCDAAQDCFSPGKLEIIRTYGDAVCYASLFCGGRKADLKALIKELARAKGLR